MLYYLVTTVYVLACFLLLLVVLLQQGKGGDMASAFGGGGSQTAFGARAGATVLTKATAVLGALFMIGAIGLGIMGQRGPGSLMRGLGAPATAPTAPVQAPAQTTTPAPKAPTAETPQAPTSGTPEAPAPAPQPKK
jgi:preprotein translocase subunit SecG